MAKVVNGAVERGPNDDPNDYVKCDRCGRVLLVKHAFCVCRG